MPGNGQNPVTPTAPPAATTPTGPGDPTTSVTQMQIPATILKSPIQSEKNIEATKYYIFNETGNIMMASTVEPSQPLQDSVRKIFEEVAVFFGAMTSAITQTINPVTKEPYSLYNYHALERVIGGSGLFVHVTEEDITHETTKIGADFSKELIESLLGLATGAGAMGFASAMMSSIAKEGLRIAGSDDHSESKVGNIVFVCEYLLGMPMVTAIVVYMDCRDHRSEIQAGPCLKLESRKTTMLLHKDTYFFVTPTWIREFAKDLESIRADPNYTGLIDWFEGLILRTPAIFGVFVEDAQKELMKADLILKPGTTYTIKGQFLPQDKGLLKFAGSKNEASITTASWQPGEITFTVSGQQETPAPIQVYDATDKTTVVAKTPGAYSIKKD